ncbi:putative short-chain dehydrogenase reductase family [Rosellinia necatrix]|uniref:Putative short-chain dehydrogenase reductase family n=1 Tax=Rosellinia necatrix TaxID=77044 RepID=A0A1W2TK97_ROSNE|nr:putative short-chain dehydrogenase reductase family [Rosellinia necatrix]
MAQFKLDGIALVVGAAGGIGREVAFTFAEAGVKGILLADLNADASAEVAEKSKSIATNPNYKCLSTGVDVVDVESVDKMVHLAVETFGRIDYCISAFGIDVAEYVPFHQTTPEDYDRVLGVNTKGLFLVTRAVGKVMLSQESVQVDLGRLGTRDIGRGSIVNVTSAMALVAVPAKAPYTTSKHAATGIAKAAAMDFKSANIRVNQVCPTWVRTPMFEEECRRIPQTPDIINKISPIKRAIEPDEVAAACLYLCTPSTLAVNGLTLTLDTGLLVGPVIG